MLIIMFLIKNVFIYMIFGGQIKVHVQIHRGQFSITFILRITREACHGSLENCACVRPAPAAINESNETLRCFVCLIVSSVCPYSYCLHTKMVSFKFSIVFFDTKYWILYFYFFKKIYRKMTLNHFNVCI